MNDVVICGIARTPMGAMQGVFENVPAPELGAIAIRRALEDAQLPSDSVDEVIMGCVLPAGTGQAPARQAALLAGLAASTPTMTINKVCGSGMKAIMLAVDAIRLGQANIVVAGGMENMTRAPHLLARARSGYRLGHDQLFDHLFTDGLEDAKSGQLMGCFADATAARYHFSREQQDQIALDSIKKAQYASDNGLFTREIAPVLIKSRKSEVEVLHDEPLARTKPEKIPSLRPAFSSDGTVTAANASSIADGAAALVIASRQEAQRRGLPILASIAGSVQSAREPEWFTLAPVGAIQNLMASLKWEVADVDLFEINEAFACVPMAAAHDLGISFSKVNIHGGACALGHPLGASGARIVVSLVAALEQKSLKKGVASLCIGGGEATALALVGEL